MNKAELVALVAEKVDLTKKATEEVRSTLTQFGAEIEKEELFGDRDLTYEVEKQKRGRFVLFTLKLNPGKITEIDRAFKIQSNLLKYLFVKLEEK